MAKLLPPPQHVPKWSEELLGIPFEGNEETYPTKRESRKIIDSKHLWGGDTLGPPEGSCLFFFKFGVPLEFRQWFEKIRISGI